jgi:hypothetical protein
MGDVVKSVSSSLGDVLGFDASADAAKEQQYGAQRAAGTLRSMYDAQKADYKPWQEAGTGALGDLQKSDLGMGNFTGDPGYQFRMQEGMKAINAGAAARGMGNSGATMKALARYGQDFATNEYNNAYNRNFSRLSGLAGYGQNAVQGLSQAHQNYGNALSGNQTSLANAMASNKIADANRMTDFYSNAISGGAAAMSAGGGGGGGGGGGMAGMASMAAMFSDERLKENISEVSKSDLQEMKKHLKPYMFNYKSDEFGQGDWIGIMAQDLEKSKLGKTVVFDDENGNKKVNIQKLFSLVVADWAGN